VTWERVKGNGSIVGVAFFFCFFLRSVTEKATAATLPLPSSSVFFACAVLQLCKEGDGNNTVIAFFLCFFFLRCYSATKKAMATLLASPSFFVFFCCIALQRSTTKKATAVVVAFFSMLWGCVTM